MNVDTFEEFYSKHCKTWGDTAIVTFYLGTVFLLWAIIIYMWGEFDITYSSLVGAVIAALLIGSASILGLAVAIVIRANDIKAVAIEGGGGDAVQRIRSTSEASSDAGPGPDEGKRERLGMMITRSRSASAGSQSAPSAIADAGSVRRSRSGDSRSGDKSLPRNGGGTRKMQTWVSLEVDSDLGGSNQTASLTSSNDRSRY